MALWIFMDKVFASKSHRDFTEIWRGDSSNPIVRHPCIGMCQASHRCGHISLRSYQSMLFVFQCNSTRTLGTKFVTSALIRLGMSFTTSLKEPVV